ncbi:MAG: putative metal-binding motif-containing protein [Myxococcota bacterium]
MQGGDCGTAIDDDGDGHCDIGSDATGDGDCLDPGEASSGDDCNDANSAIFPGAQELCDGSDNDCSGSSDEAGFCLLGWTRRVSRGWQLCLQCFSRRGGVRCCTRNACIRGVRRRGQRLRRRRRRALA